MIEATRRFTPIGIDAVHDFSQEGVRWPLANLLGSPRGVFISNRSEGALGAAHAFIAAGIHRYGNGRLDEYRKDPFEGDTLLNFHAFGFGKESEAYIVGKFAKAGPFYATVKGSYVQGVGLSPYADVPPQPISLNVPRVSAAYRTKIQLADDQGMLRRVDGQPKSYAKGILIHKTNNRAEYYIEGHLYVQVDVTGDPRKAHRRFEWFDAGEAPVQPL